MDVPLFALFAILLFQTRERLEGPILLQMIGETLGKDTVGFCVGFHDHATAIWPQREDCKF